MGSKAVNYRRGTETEHKIKAILEDKGWYVVRSAGSKGLIDLIAMNYNGDIFAIQAKRTKEKVSWSRYKDEIKELEKFARFHPAPNIKIEFWVWKDRDGWYKHIVKDFNGDVQSID